MISDPIDTALRYVNNHINGFVLKFAFEDTKAIPPVPVYTAIRKQIIDNIVWHDICMTAARPREVIIQPEWYEDSVEEDTQINMGAVTSFSLHRIPPSYRDNLPIVTVYRISPVGIALGTGFAAPMHGGTAVGVGMQVMDSIAHNNYVPIPMVELIDDDLIRLSPAQYTGSNWNLQLGIAYDHEFHGFPINSVRTLALLVVAAVKRYIYKEKRIDLDQGVIETGAEYPSVTQIIDTFSSAEQEYEELLHSLRTRTKLDPQRLRTRAMTQL